ncbi:MAG: dephospho-CoA kinase [Dysgonamonadaceae bacterium]|jgi:dephospho-CoA kinase|nr:dephospho-CoA kinase [Dysgonamonadaceae bacterium]
MKIIGITGGIGSGKSVVSKLFEARGVPVYIADLEAGKLNNSSPEIRRKLTGRFGPELYAGGILNTRMLASLIFNHPGHLAFVNSVIHPEVYKDFLNWTKNHSEKEYAGIESAILFESGFNRWVDVTVAVVAPVETRIRRVQRRDRVEREAVLSRINNQMTDEARTTDYTLLNDDRKALIPQVEKLFERIKFGEFV